MKNRFDVPKANELGLLRAKLAILGFSQKQLEEAVGDKVHGRNRDEIIFYLRNWLIEKRA